MGSILKLLFTDSLMPIVKHQYSAFYLRACILRILYIHGKLTVKETFDAIVIYTRENQTMYWHITIPHIKHEMNELLLRNYVTIQNEKFCLTDEGKNAFKNELYSTLTSNSIFAYSGLKLAKYSIIISLLALLITLLQILLPWVHSILKSKYKL